MNYRGRFAPSPTGPLHAGSMVAALASWLDARAHGGRWVVRIEDVDVPRCSPAAAETILGQLAALGLVSDEPVVWQSRRTRLYEEALARLDTLHAVYRCRCSRADVERALAALGQTPPRHGERVYPGTCRTAEWPANERAGWRLRTLDADGHPVVVHWVDRRLGAQQQNLAQAVGDFVLRRADGLWAYQLAVVVDDADQGITDVVRGEDLADNTARQHHLQTVLGLPHPRWLHTPLVLAADGQKLSKQNGASAVDTTDALAALQAAGDSLGLTAQVLHAGGLAATPEPVASWLARATEAWKARWVPGGQASPGAPGASASMPTPNTPNSISGTAR